MKKALLSFFLLLVGAGNIYATTYYVSTSGNDSYNGKTSTGAWQTVSKVNTEGLAGTFVAGDSILFNRGETWATAGTILTIYCTGTAVNPITFGAYGSGNKPIIPGVKNSYAGTYCTIQDMEVTGAFPTTGGVWIKGPYNGIVIQRMYIHDITGTSASGIYLDSDAGLNFPTNVTVQDCIISTCANRGILGGASGTSLFQNNDISYAAYNGYSLSVSSYGDVITVQGDYLHNNVGYGFATAPQVDYATMNVVGCLICNNGGGIINHSNNKASLINICYNVIYNNAGSIAIGDSSDTTDTHSRIYNNTLGPSVPSVNSQEISLRWTDGTGIIENNIVYTSTQAYYVYCKSTSTNTFNNNLYYGSARSAKFYAYGTSYANLVNWQAIGQDAQGISANPIFIDSTTYNLNLKSNSPAIDNGIDSIWQGTANIDDYNGLGITDSQGNIVAVRRKVDIGACEYDRYKANIRKY